MRLIPEAGEIEVQTDICALLREEISTEYDPPQPDPGPPPEPIPVHLPGCAPPSAFQAFLEKVQKALSRVRFNDLGEGGSADGGGTKDAGGTMSLSALQTRVHQLGELQAVLQALHKKLQQRLEKGGELAAGLGAKAKLPPMEPVHPLVAGKTVKPNGEVVEEEEEPVINPIAVQVAEMMATLAEITGPPRGSRTRRGGAAAPDDSAGDALAASPLPPINSLILEVSDAGNVVSQNGLVAAAALMGPDACSSKGILAAHKAADSCNMAAGQLNRLMGSLCGMMTMADKLLSGINVLTGQMGNRTTDGGGRKRLGGLMRRPLQHVDPRATLEGHEGG